MNTLIENISTQLQNAPFVALFLDALLKSFFVLVLAGGVCLLWRRASAATRHLLWFLAMASLPCLPLLSLTRPDWQKPVWTLSTTAGSGNLISFAVELAPIKAAGPMPSLEAAPEVTTRAGVRDVSRKISTRFNARWILIGWLAWLAGVMALLTRSVAGHYGLRKFSDAAQPLREEAWIRLLADSCGTLRVRRPVALLQSANGVMPMTWGWRRPVILLPSGAVQWPEARRRVVLLHELAHIKRYDYLTQVVAQLVCALYWFNPLVWLTARQMRLERESACDDLVLAGGCKASEYAGHLVEIAGSFRSVPQVAAIAMARSSHLQGRIAAIVDASRNRRLRSAGALAILALIGGIAVGLGGTGSNGAGGADLAGRLRQKQIAQLEEFSQQKEQQSKILEAAAGETFSPEFQRFFDAAKSGDWQTVTNMYEDFKQRHPQYNHPHRHADVGLQTSSWGPVLEVCLAYDHVIRCEPAYTQMAVDDLINSIPPGSIYFGGTDPGRGLPTAFCKSHVDADPFYTLTQNALADVTYLEYLHKTYGDQREWLGSWAEACRADHALQILNTNYASAVRMLEVREDSPDDPQWKEVDDIVNRDWQQRNERVKAILADLQARETTTGDGKESRTWAKAIYIPTDADSQQCFQNYVLEATQRLQNHQLKPGENVVQDSGRIQVSGQAAVMQINGLLAKLMFDKNPDHDFFIEESFPLDWMYPFLEPHGLIMKINRLPLSAISDPMVKRDREFWQARVDQMIGGWLKDDTSVAAVTSFGEKVFLRHDLAGFAGDPRFVANDYASRMFSKFRSSIGGLYAWRAENAADAREQERMARAADFAFRQALALCPYAPEGAKRYEVFLNRRHRETDAAQVLAMAEHFVAMSERVKSAEPSASPKASVFQLRLAMDVPTDNTEPMRVVSPAGSSRLGDLLYVTKNVFLDESSIQSAQSSENPGGSQEIDINFTDTGAKMFADITRQHLHERLAIIIDGKLWMAPVVQTEISGGKAEITGAFSAKEADALVGRINATIAK